MLPTKNGVGPSCISLPMGAWPTLLDFLAERFPHIERDEIIARMQRGEVVDSAGVTVLPERVYQARQKLFYYRNIEDEPRIPFDEVVLFQDDTIIAVDKPHFLPMSPAGRYVQETLLVRLKRKLGIDTLAPMHRLDRETAGVVLFTVQPQLRDQYAALFRRRAVQKQYQAIAPWRADLLLPIIHRSRIVAGDHFMQMREAAGPDDVYPTNSETRIELLEVKGHLARYRLSPVTGKKHQLRIHMAALGIPILYDQIYPQPVSYDDRDYTKPLQLLAESIQFSDPLTGQERRFESRRSLLAL